MMKDIEVSADALQSAIRAHDPRTSTAVMRATDALLDALLEEIAAVSMVDEIETTLRGEGAAAIAAAREPEGGAEPPQTGDQPPAQPSASEPTA